ncbi:MAG: HAD family hydrolase [Fusicatenibacter sp.]|nr:HAD family hydrolase [Lachnospiraceae bacterium]MDY2939011.1 HAD family hydrolase [Fusicatenibacter sp.]
MSRIKLIASDLDGTLLQNGAQSLGQGTCELIHRLTSEGIYFFAASGRQYPNLRRLFSPVAEEIGYICENGCVGFYQGEQLLLEHMDRADGQEILHAIWEKENAEILLSGIYTSYLQPKKMSYYHHMRDVVKNNVTLVDNIFDVQEEYMKISVYEDEGIEKSSAYWKERFGSRVAVVTSGACWLDMMPLGVDKGSALRKIQETLGIAPDECLAFGDNYNDAEMLSQVKYSVAMDNAVPAIKEQCRYHTDLVEHALEKLLCSIR